MSTSDPDRADSVGAGTPAVGPTERLLVVGDLLNERYLLQRVVGRGGMAAVWRAEDRLLHRDVAIKIFDRATGLPDGSARTVAEVRLLAGLSHPGLVAVYDADAHDGGGSGERFDFLVMELVDGPTLRQRLDRGPLPEHEVARLGAQLAAALDYVHGRGVVHRDVKPANILLVGQPGQQSAKLTDFGIARILGNDRMTMHGTTLGTANYLSPEQATGGEVGPPSDVYALGLVLLECLTGVLAYDGHGIEAAAARLLRPPDIPNRLPRAWRDLLNAMTSLHPPGRPALAAVAHTLSALAAGTVEPGPSQVGAAGPTTLHRVASAPTRLTPPAAGFARVGSDTAVAPNAPARIERRRRGVPLALIAVVGVLVALGVVVAVVLAGGGSSTPGSTSPASPTSPRSPTNPTSPTTNQRASTGVTSSPGSQTLSRSSASTTSTPPPSATGSAARSGKATPPGQAKKTGPGKGGGPGDGHGPGKT